ncbi:MAG: hypothetical protein IKN64_11765 [Desulfovibrio sp.]|nr:hypothetical protein [Desulfovibrio sp.]
MPQRISANAQSECQKAPVKLCPDHAFSDHFCACPHSKQWNKLTALPIDEYIANGGILFSSIEEASPYASCGESRDYVLSAICENIQHSLDDQRNGEYGCLLSLCEKRELANAIQRAIADENYLFTIQLLTELFKNKDLKPILYNLQKQNPEWKSLSELLNTSRIRETYMQKLQIRSVYDCSVAITSDIVAKIKQYLFDLELIIDSRIIVPDRNQIRQRSILTQPGLR